MPNKEELICAICHQPISDISVAQKLVKSEGYCCIECYVTKGIMCEKILEDIRKEEFSKKYGENATVERRVFGKRKPEDKTE